MIIIPEETAYKCQFGKRQRSHKKEKSRKGFKMKKIIIITILLLLVLSTGCMYVDPFIDAGKTVISTGQDVAQQQCKLACDNHYQMLPPGCSCPKTTTIIPVNITPSNTRKYFFLNNLQLTVKNSKKSVFFNYFFNSVFYISSTFYMLKNPILQQSILQ